MTSIINKLLGKDNEHAHKTEVKCESGSCSTTLTGGEKCGTKQECKTEIAHGETCESRTVQRDGVNIKSTISTDGKSTLSLANQQKLTDLVTKLGSTHTQIDKYAKEQTEQINEQIQREIDEVVGRSRREQEELLRKANEHTAVIDEEYRARLQLMVEEIDAAKAKRISEIEIDLNNQQAVILQAARNDIDELNKKASRLKIGVLEAAEAKAANDARVITSNANLDKASAVHQATGTTTIKTEVTAAATTTAATGSAATVHDAASGARHVTETKTVETTKHQSHDIKK
ncbi:hypothetical protein I4U23_020472 [Adineta vaga]|nr:hypothetical protein I4U23_020472 [Adineta vaga]